MMNAHNNGAHAMTVGRRMLCAVGVLALTTGAACTQKPITTGPISTGPGTLAQARTYLQGTWTLLTYDIFLPGEAPIHQTQANGSGQLTYDEFNNLTIDISVDPPTAELLDRAGILTTNGVLSTRGRAAVDMQQRTLTYILQGQPLMAATIGPLDLRRPRHWTVDGNTLTLDTRAENGATLSSGKWQKNPQ
jgi:hypothetical protein